MFRYSLDISSLYHSIIERFINDKRVAVDATLGNGHDTDFLSGNFEKTYAFDIQKAAVEAYAKKGKENVVLIHDSHENIELHVKEMADIIVYNLGYLPGGDKENTTKLESTLASLMSALKVLSSSGIIVIATYPGHFEGKREDEGIFDFTSNLNKSIYGVVMHQYINRKNAPKLYIIEKK